ncbi:MAG: zf-HC2 domain-containing protein [Candidatus Brocadiaceae bacterium]|jgi:transcriptional regulator with XRE-family HTH domain
MSCEITYEQLARFTAGDLEPNEAAEVRDHVEGCAECRRRVESLRRIDRGLNSLRRIEPSASVLMAARRLLSAETRGRSGPEIMTLQEVAEFLRVPEDALEPVADELPAFEIGGHIRVRRTRLVEWIETREHAYARARAESEVARALAGAEWRGETPWRQHVSIT